VPDGLPSPGLQPYLRSDLTKTEQNRRDEGFYLYALFEPGCAPVSETPCDLDLLRVFMPLVLGQENCCRGRKRRGTPAAALDVTGGRTPIRSYRPISSQ